MNSNFNTDVATCITKNSIYQFLSSLVNIPVTLLLMPYIIRHLGNEEFGIWALVSVITSYARLSDFGLTESSIKFIAEFKATNETNNINLIINTTLVAYIALIIMFGTLFLVSLPFIVDIILNIPHTMRDQTIHVFSISIIIFCINILTGVFSSLIIGFQQMQYTSVITMLSVLISAFGYYIFIRIGYGLIGLIYSNAISTLFLSSAYLITAKRLFPQLKFNPIANFSKDIWKMIFGFGWKVHVTNLTQLLVFQIDRVLLSHYVGLESVGYYEVANRIASQAKGFLSSLLRPMTPAASALQATDESQRLAGLYRRSFKYMALVAIPISFMIIGLAHPFIRTWMGSGFDRSAVTIQLLMAAYMINLLTGPGGSILSGINKPELSMRSSSVAAILNFTLCFILVRIIGYYGIVLSIFCSIIVSGIYFIYLVHQHIIGLNWKIYQKTLTIPLTLAMIFNCVILLMENALLFNGYLTLLAIGTTYMFFFYYFIFNSQYLDDYDISIIRTLNPF